MTSILSTDGKGSVETTSDTAYIIGFISDADTVDVSFDNVRIAFDQSSTYATLIEGREIRTALAGLSSFQDHVNASKLTVSIDEDRVHELGGSALITLGYAPGKDVSKLRIYYVDDDNNILEEMELVSYDPNTGDVSFRTTHFSSYVVCEDLTTPAEPSKEDSSLFVMIGAALAVVILGIVGFAVFRKKHPA